MNDFGFILNDCLLNTFGREFPFGFRIYDSQSAFFKKEFERAEEEFLQRRASFISDYKRLVRHPVSGCSPLFNYNRRHPTSTEHSISQLLSGKSLIEREAYWEHISSVKIRKYFRDTFHDNKKKNVIQKLSELCLTRGFNLNVEQKRDIFSLTATDGRIIYSSTVDDIGRRIMGKMNFIHAVNVNDRQEIKFTPHALLPDMELYDKVYGAPAFSPQEKYNSDEFLLNILVNFIVGFSFVTSSDALFT